MGFSNRIRGCARTAALLSFMMVMFSDPASANNILYNNTPADGCFVSTCLNAFVINTTFQVADSFTLSGNSTLTGVNFGAWVFPDDTLKTVEWEIVTGTPFSSYTIVDNGTANVATTLLFVNPSDGADIDTASFTLPKISLNSGTYYLVLFGAVGTTNEAIGWDINDGPSTAYDSGLVSITNPSGSVAGYPDASPGSNSESFQILTPEPGTLTLLGTGLIFLMLLCSRRQIRSTSCAA